MSGPVDHQFFSFSLSKEVGWIIQEACAEKHLTPKIYFVKKMEICGLWLYFFFVHLVPSNAILGAQICMAIKRCSAFDFLGRQNS